jgi:hypothetical protein
MMREEQKQKCVNFNSIINLYKRKKNESKIKIDINYDQLKVNMYIY